MKLVLENNFSARYWTRTATKSSTTAATRMLDYLSLGDPGACGASGASTTSTATFGVCAIVRRVASRRLRGSRPGIRAPRSTFSAPPFAAGFSLNAASRLLANLPPDCVFLGVFVSRLLRRCPAWPCLPSSKPRSRAYHSAPQRAGRDGSGTGMTNNSRRLWQARRQQYLLSSSECDFSCVNLTSSQYITFLIFLNTTFSSRVGRTSTGYISPQR